MYFNPSSNESQSTHQKLIGFDRGDGRSRSPIPDTIGLRSGPVLTGQDEPVGVAADFRYNVLLDVHV